MSLALTQRLERGFKRAFGSHPELIARAPGRVNIIGEHTDYNGGYALPMAISAETSVALRRRGDDQIRVFAVDYDEVDEFSYRETVQRSSAGGWRNYVRGVFAIMASKPIASAGVDIAIAGDIPKGTGLSSSASLEVAIITALLAGVGRSESPQRIARWAQAAETIFSGVNCGNLDQIASAASVAGAALLVDCRSLDLRTVPLPQDVAAMIVQSGVERSLEHGGYNIRRSECEAAARALGVPDLRDASIEMLNAPEHAMPDILFRRARHVVTENLRTLSTAKALLDGNLSLVAQLMAESHRSQREDFDITVPQTDKLVSIISEALGDQGGVRQAGGGFGGAVVALLHESAVDRVRDHVTQRYLTPGGAKPAIRIEPASPGAGTLAQAS